MLNGVDNYVAKLLSLFNKKCAARRRRKSKERIFLKEKFSLESENPWSENLLCRAHLDFRFLTYGRGTAREPAPLLL